jgi:hypothetical protein
MRHCNWILRFCLPALVVTSLSIETVYSQQVLPRYGIFVFSNLCLEPSGDVAGYRLTLVRLGDGDHILLEWSEGPKVEAAGYVVKVDDRTSRLSFMVDLPGAASKPPFQYSYTGEISRDVILLKKSDEPGPGNRLLRINDMSGKPGVCGSSTINR